MYLYEFVQQLHDQIDNFEDWYSTKMTEEPDKEYFDEPREEPKVPPFLVKLAHEHLDECRACAERATRHHLSLEEPYTDVQLGQALELATITLKKCDQINQNTIDFQAELKKDNQLDSLEEGVEEVVKWFSKDKKIGLVGALVSAITFLGGLLI